MLINPWNSNPKLPNLHIVKNTPSIKMIITSLLSKTQNKWQINLNSFNPSFSIILFKCKSKIKKTKNKMIQNDKLSEILFVKYSLITKII